jgi:predicted amidohydrolase
MKVAVSQWDTLEGKIKQNLKKARYFVDRAIGENVDIVVFPELFLTGYDMDFIKTVNTKKLFEDFVSLQKNHTAIVGSTPYEVSGKILNRMFFLAQHTTTHYYDKIHLFTKGGEHNVFTKGNEIKTFTYKGYKISMLICYDIRFTYLFSYLFKEEIDLLIVSAQWPLSRLDQWLLLLRARALELQCYVIASNRCGSGKNIEFAGHSLIISPKGKIITKLTKQEGFTLWELNKEEIKNFRKEIPVYKDTIDALS